MSFKSIERTPISRTRTFFAQTARGNDDPLNYFGNDYVQLSGDLALKANGKYACCGSARESILLNMGSDKLKKIFQMCFDNQNEALAATQPIDYEDNSDMTHQPYPEVQNDIGAALELSFNLDNPLNTLKHIVNFVSQQFTQDALASTIEALIARKVDANGMVPLDVLVENNIGVCRHQALLVGYLLSQLIQQTHSESATSIYRFRTNLIKSTTEGSVKYCPHAVIIYRDPDNHLYLLDATRKNPYSFAQGLAIDITHIDGNELQQYYAGYNTNLFLESINQRYPTQRESSEFLSLNG